MLDLCCGLLSWPSSPVGCHASALPPRCSVHSVYARAAVLCFGAVGKRLLPSRLTLIATSSTVSAAEFSATGLSCLSTVMRRLLTCLRCLLFSAKPPPFRGLALFWVTSTGGLPTRNSWVSSVVRLPLLCPACKVLCWLALRGPLA